MIAGGLPRTTATGLRYLIHEHYPEGSIDYKRFSQRHINKPNCVYWPHYSLRPSLLRSKVFTDLGHYKEISDHFEYDYAKEYRKAGYVSVFFDTICSHHTGKLTSVVDGINAYKLNGIQQFGNLGYDTIVKETKEAFNIIHNNNNNHGNNHGNGSGNNHGNGSGNNPGNNSGNNPGNSSGNNPENNPGNNHGNNPENNSGNSSGNNSVNGSMNILTSQSGRSSWIKIYKYDSVGNDLFYFPELSTPEELFDVNLDAICFNSLGYVKNKIEPVEKWEDMSGRFPNIYMLIHKRRYKEQLGSDEIYRQEMMKVRHKNISVFDWLIDSVFTTKNTDGNKSSENTLHKIIEHSVDNNYSRIAIINDEPVNLFQLEQDILYLIDNDQTWDVLTWNEQTWNVLTRNTTFDNGNYQGVISASGYQKILNQKYDDLNIVKTR